jgi:hypothetical protein
MRVLTSVDMEGIGGVVDADDISPGHAEYERNRVLLTAEANAAVRGVYAYDADARVRVTEASSATTARPAPRARSWPTPSPAGSSSTCAVTAARSANSA